MAVEIGSAYFTLIPSMAGTAAAVRTGLAAPAVTGAFTQGGAAGGAALGAGFASKAVPIIGGALAAVGIADFFSNAIDAASNLNESANAVRVSFGDAAGEVENLGSTAASRLGLSQVDFNSLAVRFSSFAGTIAGENGDLVDVLDTLTTRGADFASVYNIDVADALGLFQSGLAGESEPLRRFGIDLSEATVKQTAYRTGIADVGSELTAQQKVQARYQAILEQTAKVEGDRANTSDELANQQRENAAKMEDALARIGEALLPAATAFANFVGSEEGQELLNKYVDLFIKLEPVFTGLADAAIAFFDATADGMTIFATFLDMVTGGKISLEDLATVVDSIPDGLKGAISGFADFVFGIYNTVVGFFNGIIGAAEGAINAIGGLLGLAQVRLPRMMTMQNPFPGLFNAAANPVNRSLGLTNAQRNALGFPGMASGGRVLGAGYSWVGERGPELAYMPSGAEVIPSDVAGVGIELGPRTRRELVEAIMAQRVLEADGRAIAETSNRGNARGAALGAA